MLVSRRLFIIIIHPCDAVVHLETGGGLERLQIHLPLLNCLPCELFLRDLPWQSAGLVLLLLRALKQHQQGQGLRPHELC